MAKFAIIKAENVRRYTTYTVDSDSLTPDQTIYIDCGDDVYEPVNADGDKFIEGILSDEAKATSVAYGDADDLAVTYFINGLSEILDA